MSWEAWGDPPEAWECPYCNDGTTKHGEPCDRCQGTGVIDGSDDESSRLSEMVLIAAIGYGGCLTQGENDGYDIQEG